MAGDGNDFPLIFHPVNASTVRRASPLPPSLFPEKTGYREVRWAEAPLVAVTFRPGTANRPAFLWEVNTQKGKMRHRM